MRGGGRGPSGGARLGGCASAWHSRPAHLASVTMVRTSLSSSRKPLKTTVLLAGAPSLPMVASCRYRLWAHLLFFLSDASRGSFHGAAIEIADIPIHSLHTQLG